MSKHIEVSRPGGWIASTAAPAAIKRSVILVIAEVSDADLAHRIVGDLRKRGHRAILSEVGPELGNLSFWVGAHPTPIIVVPENPSSEQVAAFANHTRDAIEKGATPIVITDPASRALDEVDRSHLRHIIRRRIPQSDYDAVFSSLFEALLAPYPSWLTVVLRPSVLEAPTGVGWWGDELLVADEHFGHLAYGPDMNDVVLPGLSEPHHIALDRAKVLICDRGANEIVTGDLHGGAFTPRSRIGKICGEDLLHPNGIHQGHGRTVIADTDNHRVLFTDGDLWGRRRPKWQDLPTPTNGYRFPCAVQTDERAIWVADTFRHRVVIVPHGASEVLEFGTYGWMEDDLAYPVGIATWRDWVFVAEAGQKQVRCFTVGWDTAAEDGPLTVVSARQNLASGWIGNPFGLAVNREDRLAVTDRDRRCIWLIDLDEYVANLPSAA